MTTNEVAWIYDTIMSIPGMNEMVKIDMKISRKNILLLHSDLLRGLANKQDDKSQNLLENLSQDSLSELKNIAEEYLSKAGLAELNEKLKIF